MSSLCLHGNRFGDTWPLCCRHGNLMLLLHVQAASLTVDLCGEDQEAGYCAVSNVAVHTDW